jgi:hypothetical protein
MVQTLIKDAAEKANESSPQQTTENNPPAA